MNKKILLLLSLCFLTGCTEPDVSEKSNKSAPKASNQTEISVQSKPEEDVMITRRPKATAEMWNRGKLDKVPSLQKRNGLYVLDLENYDLSNVDFSNRIDDFGHAQFSTRTIWPNELPEEINPSTVLEMGKNPGLNIRSLHEQGITGKGVGIAIIDNTLLVDHVEYKENLKYYDEIFVREQKGHASTHGPAVASVAVGKSVGVAPDADLYFIAVDYRKGASPDFDVTHIAEAIERITDLNETLKAKNKIRVLSISNGWGDETKGVEALDNAVQRALEHNILVLTACNDRYYDLKLHGLARYMYNDPDVTNSYSPHEWWAEKFYNGDEIIESEEELSQDMRKWPILTPMDARTVASSDGTEEYRFLPNGGTSWNAPYIAGMYGLACQVSPDITPEKFFEILIRTGEFVDIEKNGEVHKMGRVVNPVGIINELQKVNED